MNSNNVNNVICLCVRGRPFHNASFIANEYCSMLIRTNKTRSSSIKYRAMPLSRSSNLCYYFIIKKNNEHINNITNVYHVAVFDMHE